MIYQNMLHRFMQEKASILYENGVYVQYYKQEDAKNIFNYPDIHAQNIWKSLNNYIINGDINGTHSETCVFCIDDAIKILKSDNQCLYPFNRCTYCEYKEYHKVCTKDILSDYQMIHYYLNKNNIKYKDIFTSNFYLKLIFKIEDIYVKKK